ncbi:hypothetical protein K432DRAFT_288619 [Lepidopterella palustris CBS 459.81]|uniref:Uncharacterized protein n=1 Tax=Lepidopterella palustris CBS 459.81 TaxID=1314670 RepID=A0A8E2EIW3_9PEZI|nr:hypothetical protein K432DRAFT_288619 [Lepidopterella palustris CBS 459.81]
MTMNTTLSNNGVSWPQSNQTRMLIDNFKLAQVQTLRTMHITLGAFSLGLALLMVFRILHDARRASLMRVTLRPRRFDFLTSVHPAELVPLVLASGIAVQEIIFVTVQSTALDSVMVPGCKGIAMVVFPAIFLQGYINLVFGAETAIRSLKTKRFAPRGKWTTTICLAVVAFMLLLTWIPTVVWLSPHHCVGSLVWFPLRYELIALVLLVLMIFFFLALAAVISIQLMRTIKVDPNERIAASRVCYYLLVATIIYALIIPFEIQAHLHDFDSSVTTTRIAEIPLFSSGVYVSFIHLFLRVNASRMAIKPLGAPWQSRPRIRFFGPSDLELNISGPLMNRPDSQDGLVARPEKERMAEEGEYYGPEKDNRRPEERAASPGLKTPVDPTKWPLPPNPVQGMFSPKSPSTPGHKRTKSTYSLFPTRAEEIPRLPATVYTPPSASASAATPKRTMSSATSKRQTQTSISTDAPSVTDVHEASLLWLHPPPPLFSSQRHRRDESTESSATVQIGLRFSVAPAAIAAANCSALNRALSPTPATSGSLRRDPSDSSGESIGLPIQVPSSDSSFTDLPLQTGNTPSPPLPPPLAIVSAMRPNLRTKPALVDITAQNSGIYLQAARDKVLPPTPRGSAVSRLSQPTALSGLRMNPVSPAKTSPISRPVRSPLPEGGWI